MKTASKVISCILLCALLICHPSLGYADPGPAVPDGSSITIHYIDVGQADAALVLCDNATMLIVKLPFFWTLCPLILI